MIYLKNNTTNEIVSYNVSTINVLSKNIRNVYGEATQEEVDSFLLKEAKKEKRAQIAPARNNFIYADVAYKDTTFTNSPTSGNNLTVEIATETTLIEWLDAGGDQVDLTLEEAKELAGLIKAKRRAGYFQESTLIKQIDACTTVEEVEAIEIIF